MSFGNFQLALAEGSRLASGFTVNGSCVLAVRNGSIAGFGLEVMGSRFGSTTNGVFAAATSAELSGAFVSRAPAGGVIIVSSSGTGSKTGS